MIEDVNREPLSHWFRRFRKRSLLMQAVAVVAFVGFVVALYKLPQLRPPVGIVFVIGFAAVMWRFIDDAPEWLKTAVFLIFVSTAAWDVYLHRGKSVLGLTLNGILHSGSASCGGPAPPAGCDD